jgi:hypothetical protein
VEGGGDGCCFGCAEYYLFLHSGSCDEDLSFSRQKWQARSSKPQFKTRVSIRRNEDNVGQRTMDQKPPTSYANGVLTATGFKFQPRNHHGCRLEIKQFSSLDIDSVIRDVKTELLSSLVQNFVWCEINETDLKLYGDIAVAKLIRVAQLTIEYLIHAKDKLASNLNALAKKYSAKKREIETLSKLPLHPQLTSPGSRASWPFAKTSSTCSHSLCPTHECNLIKSPDVIDEDASSKFTATTLNTDSFHLNVISSTNAIYLRLNVEESITVQNLKNRLISRLLLADGAGKTNFDSHSLYYKDNELKDSSRTLNDYQVGNGEAIVFMPRLQHDENDRLKGSIESKLEKLTLIATTSHEELILATRAFQFQLSMQEASKEAFLNHIGKHIRDALHSQVQQATCVEDMNNHDEASNLLQPLTVDEGKETNEKRQSQGDASSKNEHGRETGDDVVDSRKLSDVPLRVDTSAKGFNIVVSPFHPPSEIVSPFKLPCECDIAQNILTTDAMEKIETPKSMNRTVNADLEIEFSMNSLNSMLDDVDEVVDKLAGTPSKGYLLYHGNADSTDDMAHANSPSTGSEGTNNKENDEKPLWSSEELLADGNDSEGITEIINHCSAAILKISSGMTASSEADDMQSISISQSEQELTNHHAEVDVKKIQQGRKKKGHFYQLKKVTKGLLLSKK